MDIRQFELSNPWRVGRPWQVPSIKRRLLPEVIDWMDEPEVLVLTGARQVGKTSIVYQLVSWLLESYGVAPADVYYFNLDIPGVADLVGNPASLLRFLEAGSSRRSYVFVDEVQRLERPGLLIKGLQDMRLPLKFILTGSSSLDIRVKTGEALTGRKQVFHVSQLSFDEYLSAKSASVPQGAPDQEDAELYLPELNHHLDRYATYGGYPAVVLSGSDDKRLGRLGEIYRSYLEKDIAGFLRVGNMAGFRRLVTVIAGQQGGLVNIQELAGTLGMHRDTVERYLEHLEQTFVLHRLTPFCRNQRTELSRMPKLYFADPGLRNLAQGMLHLFPDRPDRGQIAEGIVADYLSAKPAPGTSLHFWRTKAKAEVDFVTEASGEMTALEVKAGALARPRISRGFRSFLAKYRPERAFLLNRSLWATVEHEGIIVTVLPLAVFLAREQGRGRSFHSSTLVDNS